jgi:hypothetical protein
VQTSSKVSYAVMNVPATAVLAQLSCPFSVRKYDHIGGNVAAQAVKRTRA